MTSRALRLRRSQPDAFTSYQPVPARGSATAHLLAFDRGGAITVVTRLPVALAAAGGWADTVVDLPTGLVDVLTGAERGGTTLVSDLLGTYPVALLARIS